MVKPSKSMQPEQVDEKTLAAGRRGTKKKKDSMTDGSDSFRNYMARKIAVQRQQFGLVLPPPPQTTTTAKQDPVGAPSRLRKRDQPHESPQSPYTISSVERSSVHQPRQQQQQRAISFEQGTKPPILLYKTTSTSTAGDGSSNHNKQRQHASSSSKTATRSILRHLARRHGHVHEKRRRVERLWNKRKHADDGDDDYDKRQLDNDDNNKKRKKVLSLMMTDDQDTPSRTTIIDESTPFTTTETMTVDSTWNNSGVFLCENRSDLDGPLTTTNVRKSPSSATSPLFRSEGQTVDDKETVSPAAATKQLVHGSSHTISDGFLQSNDASQSAEATASAIEAIDMTSPSTRRSLRPDLFFYGVVIKVQGFTDPDEHTLRRLIQKHGGDYETYETTRVTHIIASAMSTAKQTIYKNQRKPTPVCVPAWIVDSAAAGMQLPHGKYLLNKEEKQNELQAMFQKQIMDQQQQQQQHQVPPNKPSLLGLGAASSTETNCKRVPAPKQTAAVGRIKTPSHHQTFTKGDHGELSETDKGATSVSPIVVGSPELQGKTNKQFINGKIRSVGTDPTFVENYFKSSRLSFIGSYKQRIQNATTTDRKGVYDIPTGATRFVFHVDMDQFFASVVLRNYPEFRSRPVAISHLGLEKGQHVPNESNANFKNSTSECATVNYEARKYGITKGMFLKSAYELCPDLIVLKYDFQGYDEVAQEVLEILESFCVDPTHPGVVEPISCDEYIMEVFVTANGPDINAHVISLAEALRAEIFGKTQCTATAGIGPNKYLAKVACDKAKPNGSYVVTDYVSLLSGKLLRDMPGVGWRSEPKLKEKGLSRVDDVWELGLEAKKLLCEIMGAKNGERMYEFCHGRDERDVLPNAERKTVGAECNYGVRFDGPYGIDHFMMELAKEVERRMSGIGVKGSKVTLKLKKRKENAKEPPKFLGHGRCHNLSKSGNLKQPSRDASTIASFGMKLYQQFDITNVHDVRGMGLTLSNLHADDELAQSKSSAMKQWLSSSAASRDLTFQQEIELGNEQLEGTGLLLAAAAADNFRSSAAGTSKLTSTKSNADSFFTPRECNARASLGSKVPITEGNGNGIRHHAVERKTTKRTVPGIRKVDSYIEDLVPLKKFLRSSAASHKAAVPFCLCFLTIVLAERPRSLRPLLRVMARQSRQWERNSAGMVSILSTVNVFLNGMHLDESWLLGVGSR